jgi:proteasome lid subunit RPN8/RPN11
MDPVQVARAYTEMREHGWQLGATVHSHPTGEATPSARDLREGFYPHAWMMIVALVGPEPEIRVWRHSPGAAGDADELALGIVRA